MLLNLSSENKYPEVNFNLTLALEPILKKCPYLGEEKKKRAGGGKKGSPRPATVGNIHVFHCKNQLIETAVKITAVFLPLFKALQSPDPTMLKAISHGICVHPKFSSLERVSSFLPSTPSVSCINV